jgi:hypothetical protein
MELARMVYVPTGVGKLGFPVVTYVCSTNVSPEYANRVSLESETIICLPSP